MLMVRSVLRLQTPFLPERPNPRPQKRPPSPPQKKNEPVGRVSFLQAIRERLALHENAPKSECRTYQWALKSLEATSEFFHNYPEILVVINSQIL